MTRDELRQAALDCLAEVFLGKQPQPPYVIQAAVAIVTAPSLPIS